jgi:hypothetical protein
MQHQSEIMEKGRALSVMEPLPESQTLDREAALPSPEIWEKQGKHYQNTFENEQT